MAPKKNFRVLFLYPNLMLQTTFPLAIALFSALLKRKGYLVDIFDTTFYRTEKITSDEARVENLQIAKFSLGKDFSDLPGKEQMIIDLNMKVKEFQPDLIAVSILEDVFPLALELIDPLKHLNIPTIAGGIFPTFAPEKVIKIDGIDMLCIGEGEELLLELCRKMFAKEEYFNIRNLWIKTGNKIIANKIGPKRDLRLNPPPDFDLFDARRFYKPMKGKVYRMGLVETHRGCPYTCSFCNSNSQSILYKKKLKMKFFRNRDIENIQNELKILVNKFRIEFIYFPAEVFFSGSQDYLKEFVKMYKKFKIPFFCQNRAEVLNEKTINDLIAMNCHSLAVGIEHGSEEYRRNKLNRKVTNDVYINAIKRLEKTRIKVSVNNIIGFPDETRELVFDTINLNRHFNVYQINAYYFAPYHGTELREYCVEKGYIKENTLVSCITKNTVINMPPPYLSPGEIRGLVRTFNLYARFPLKRFQEIAVAERFDKEGNKMFRKLKAEYWKKHLN